MILFAYPEKLIFGVGLDLTTWMSLNRRVRRENARRERRIPGCSAKVLVDFQFVKTNGLSFDVVVVAALIAAAEMGVIAWSGEHVH